MSILDAKFGLFYHDTGTGKTCKIIKQMELYQGIVRNFLVIIPNDGILTQFVSDLLKTCAPNLNYSKQLILHVKTFLG